MKNNFIGESLTVIVLLLLLVIILNPFNLWMPDMVHMTIFALTLVAFAAVATFVLREKTVDERDTLHRMMADRVAFLTGSAVLLIASIVQSLMGTLDHWLVVSLIVMIVIKFVARVYADRYR